MIQDVHPGSGSRIRILIFYPSRIFGSKRHRIPDPNPQHWKICCEIIRIFLLAGDSRGMGSYCQTARYKGTIVRIRELKFERKKDISRLVTTFT
jgi:hypothetical protein